MYGVRMSSLNYGTLKPIVLLNEIRRTDGARVKE